MKYLLTLFLIIVICCCQHHNEIPIVDSHVKCESYIKFNFNGDTTNYRSDTLMIPVTFTIPLSSDDKTTMSYIGNSNIFMLNDNRLKTISIWIHNKIEKEKESNFLNTDSVIRYNIENLDFSYINCYSKTDSIKAFFSDNQIGISVELMDSAGTYWYSHNPDTISVNFNQSNSTFNIIGICTDDANLYEGILSCKLYNRDGKEVEIERAEFNFKIK